jgi:hypothetical protein
VRGEDDRAPNPLLRVYVCYRPDRHASALVAPLRGEPLSIHSARRIVHHQRQRFRGLHGLRFWMTDEPIAGFSNEMTWDQMRERLDALMGTS